MYAPGRPCATHPYLVHARVVLRCPVPHCVYPCRAGVGVAMLLCCAVPTSKARPGYVRLPQNLHQRRTVQMHGMCVSIRNAFTIHPYCCALMYPNNAPSRSLHKESFSDVPPQERVHFDCFSISWNVRLGHWLSKSMNSWTHPCAKKKPRQSMKLSLDTYRKRVRERERDSAFNSTNWALSLLSDDYFCPQDGKRS